MKLGLGATALLTAAATSALAQTPVPPTQLAAGVKPAAAPRPAGVPGVSAAGNAALTKIGKPDPVSQQLAGQLQAVATQLGQTLQAPTLDVEKFAALLKKREGLQAQLGARSDDHLIAALRVLPANDRIPFLKAVSMATQQRVAAAPH